MRWNLLLLLFSFLLAEIYTRPSNAVEENYREGEIEFENEEEAVDDESLRDDEDANNQLSDYTLEKIRNIRNKKNYVSLNSPGKIQSASAYRHFTKYTDKNSENEQPDTSQDFSNRDNRYKAHRINDERVDKRNLEPHSMSNDDGDLLFENNINNEAYANRHKDEAAASRDQWRNTGQYDIYTENKLESDNYKSEQINGNRDRRYALESNKNESINLTKNSGDKDQVLNTASEDEEAAIKRHVKKLSDDELQQLLNTLTEDKKVLLKKIMDTDNDNINKREITKKAGAIEDNSCIESAQSDANKIQSGSSSDVSTDYSLSQNTDTTKSSKQTENQLENDIPSTKNVEIKNSPENIETKSELSSQINNPNQLKIDSVNYLASNIDTTSHQINHDSNAQIMSKNENKREAHIEDAGVSSDDLKMLQNNLDYDGIESRIEDQGYVYSQDEDKTQLMHDESQLYSNHLNTYKREAFLDKDTDLSDSIKSLEESFPNSNVYDGSGLYSRSNMSPLIRVKRKNINMPVRKRAASLLPDAKVSYFPYKAENEDEDNDEGNEFDDEGFYDRTSNVARSNDDSKSLNDFESINNFEVTPKHTKIYEPSPQKNIISDEQAKIDKCENVENDITSLGSDTDGVLSGVGGVDDNLMYSSESRAKRIASDNPKVEKESTDYSNVKRHLLCRSTPWNDDEMEMTPENRIKPPNYQENDAFGPLPNNYEGELGRYKRIKRVKQISDIHETTRLDT